MPDSRQARAPTIKHRPLLHQMWDILLSMGSMTAHPLPCLCHVHVQIRAELEDRMQTDRIRLTPAHRVNQMGRKTKVDRICSQSLIPNFKGLFPCRPCRPRVTCQTYQSVRGNTMPIVKQLPEHQSHPSPQTVRKSGVFRSQPGYWTGHPDWKGCKHQIREADRVKKQKVHTDHLSQRQIKRRIRIAD
jgi:hypothetical protein